MIKRKQKLLNFNSDVKKAWTLSSPPLQEKAEQIKIQQLFLDSAEN